MKITKDLLPSRQIINKELTITLTEQKKKKQRTANSTYKKLAVQWLNEALCFVSSSVVADSFRLRNRQLLVAAKRYMPL